MPYRAEISRRHPACLLFLIDQSGSMQDALDRSDAVQLERPIHVDGRTYTHRVAGPSKAQVVAEALNRLLANLILACTKGEVLPRDYFHVGVVGYGAQVRDLLPGPGMDGSFLRPLSVVAQHPLRVELRTQMARVDGRRPDEPAPFPVWVEPTSDGGTPMCAALRLAHDQVARWLVDRPGAFPPIVLHLTDGESDDGDPLPVAQQLMALSSTDGHVLLFNLHITADFPRPEPICFPASPDGLPGPFARQLFLMSSRLPPPMIEEARRIGLRVAEQARGYVFNADLDALVAFLHIGTRPADPSTLR